MRICHCPARLPAGPGPAAAGCCRVCAGPRLSPQGPQDVVLLKTGKRRSLALLPLVRYRDLGTGGLRRASLAPTAFTLRSCHHHFCKGARHELVRDSTGDSSCGYRLASAQPVGNGKFSAEFGVKVTQHVNSNNSHPPAFAGSHQSSPAPRRREHLLLYREKHALNGDVKEWLPRNAAGYGRHHRFCLNRLK